MNRMLLKKSLGEAQWLLLASAALLFGFCWIRVWIVSTIETPRFAAMLEQIWDKVEQFSPVTLEQLISYPGRVSLTYVEPIVIFIVSIWAIGRGSDCVAGEINRGTMEMLLAQPVSRVQVLWSQAFVTVGGIAVLALAAWLGTWAGIQTNTVTIQIEPPKIGIPGLLELPIPFIPPRSETVPMSHQVQARQMVPAAFNVFSLGFCVAGLATMLSACDRYRWRTIGLVSGIYVVQFIAKGLAMSTERLVWLKRCTFFTAFEPQAFVAVAVEDPGNAWAWILRDAEGVISDLGPLGYNAILLGIGMVGYLAATVVFCRRDLPAPL